MNTLLSFVLMTFLSVKPVLCPAASPLDTKRNAEEAIARGETFLKAGDVDTVGELGWFSLGVGSELSDPRDRAFFDALGGVDVAMRGWLATALRRGNSFCHNDNLVPKDTACLEIPDGDIMKKQQFGVYDPPVRSADEKGPSVIVSHRNRKVSPHREVFYGCTLWTMPKYSQRNVLSRYVFLRQKNQISEYVLPTHNMLIGDMAGVEQEAFLGFVDVGRTWPAVLIYDPRDGRGDCDMLDLYWLDEAQNAFVRKHVIDYQGTLDEYDEAAAVAIYTGDSPFPGPDQPEVATWRIDIRQFVRDDGMENAATRVE